MKKISLTKGKFALVDDADLALVSQFKWYYSNEGYALRGIGAHRKEYMHRLILGAKKGQVTDHINGNRCDNRRSNIRLGTYAQNSMNQRRHKKSATGIRGIRYKEGKWEANLSANSKRYYLGRFGRLEDAVTTYNDAARKLCGEFASLIVIK